MTIIEPNDNLGPVRSPFMFTYIYIGYIVGVFQGAGTAYPSRAPVFIPGVFGWVRVAHLFSFLCCVFALLFFAVLCLVCPVLHVSLVCLCLIALSVFSNVYLSIISNHYVIHTIYSCNFHTGNF